MIVYTDTALVSEELTHIEASVLGYWQDGANRSHSHRRIARELGLKPDDVLDAMRSLLAKGFVWTRKIKQSKPGPEHLGGKFHMAKARRLHWVADRFSRDANDRYVVISRRLVNRISKSRHRYKALKLRYLGLLCLDQQRRGAASLCDKDAAALLGVTPRVIHNMRQALTKDGTLVEIGRRKNQPIFVIPLASTPPEPARFRHEASSSLCRRLLPLRSSTPTSKGGSRASLSTTTSQYVSTYEDSEGSEGSKLSERREKVSDVTQLGDGFAVAAGDGEGGATGETSPSADAWASVELLALRKQLINGNITPEQFQQLTSQHIPF